MHSLGCSDVLTALFVFLDRVSVPPPLCQNQAGLSFMLLSPKPVKLCMNVTCGTNLGTNSSVCAGQVGVFVCLHFQWGERKKFLKDAWK